jgi:N-methylhydantoinase A
LANIEIGIDTGGTFTDIVVVDAATGESWRHKVPTTPDDASRGILEGIAGGLEIAGADPESVSLVCHGTTLATNAVLEGKWAKTGLITTAGFRDILELARQRRPSFFNLDIEKPIPPALREARLEVPERVDHAGSVVTPLDETAVKHAAEALRDMGCLAVAVCFLHSYANPAHEERAMEIIRSVWPEAYISGSAAILSEFREFERFATAAVNASLMPLVDAYLQRFEDGLGAMGVPAPPRVMQSNGGAVSPQAIRHAPVNTFFSGPAGGVIGAVGVGVSAGIEDIVTFDMGGTSTDVCLIQGGAPSRQNVREMGGFPVRTRTLDLHTISAGAMPGPACYGRGGDLPTVTDANMALGRLNPYALLDGRMAVFPANATEAIERHLCGPLQMDVTRASSGVLDIVNVNMMGAVRVISVEQGEDPRRFALMAFGGAGPLHATDIAQSMAIPTVIVPPSPGVLSAVGLLNADARGDFSATQLLPADTASTPALNEALSRLSLKAKDWLAGEQLAANEAQYEHLAEMRYLGQNYELAITFIGNTFDTALLTDTVGRFHAAHLRAYGHSMPERPAEIVNLRLAVTVSRANVDKVPTGPNSSRFAESSRRPVWYPETQFIETPVYRRDDIPIGARFSGPAVIEQMDATTVIPPDADVRSDAGGNLIIDLSAGAAT